jgi:hypothetical protein
MRTLAYFLLIAGLCSQWMTLYFGAIYTHSGRTKEIEPMKVKVAVMILAVSIFFIAACGNDSSNTPNTNPASQTSGTGGTTGTGTSANGSNLISPSASLQQCISTFNDSNNWIAFQNNCSQTVHVNFCNAVGQAWGAKVMGPGQSSTTAYSNKEMGTFAIAVCPSEYTAVDSQRNMWKYGESFLCGLI